MEEEAKVIKDHWNKYWTDFAAMENLYGAVPSYKFENRPSRRYAYVNGSSDTVWYDEAQVWDVVPKKKDIKEEDFL